MNISVIGCGYVGLVSGACFAKLGHDVMCLDRDIQKIISLRRGILPIYEPGLKNLIKTNVKNKKLKFTTNFKEAIKESLVIFITADIPLLVNGEADFNSLEIIVRNIALNMKDYHLIVEKSTAPVGTTEWIKRKLTDYLKQKIKLDVASNPEFLREGQAINDFMHPDRVVIGIESRRAKEILINLYKPLKAPLVIVNVKSAELIKYASNTFLATKISFINAVAQICERVGADVGEVSKGMGLDKRIAPYFLDAGIGYGGSCLPKDVEGFIKMSKKNRL